MGDRNEITFLMREMAERLETIARATTDSVLAAKLAQMARELAAEAAGLEAASGADPASPKAAAPERRVSR